MINFHSNKSFALLVLGLLTVLMLTACGSSAEKLNQDGNKAFTREQFEQALVAYQSAQIENPELAELYYNAANSLYRQGNYNAAMEQLQVALSYAEDESLTEHSFYNLGNNHFNSQEFDTAVEAYKQALLINPGDQEAKYNLELALQQQQQEQDQEQNKQDEKSQEGEDQEDEKSIGSDQSEENKNEEQHQDQSQDGEDQEPSEDNRGNEGDSSQDQGNPEENNPENKSGDQPVSGREDKPNQSEGPSQAPSPGERMTEEQARQLLAAIAEDSSTLWERLGQIFFVRDLPPIQDW